MVGETDKDANNLTESLSEILEIGVCLLQVSQVNASSALVFLNNDSNDFIELAGDLENVVYEVLRNALGIARGRRIKAVPDNLVRDLVGAASLLDKVRGLVDEVERLEDVSDVAGGDVVDKLGAGLEGLLAKALGADGLGVIIVEARNEAALEPVEAREVVLHMSVVKNLGRVHSLSKIVRGGLEERLRVEEGGLGDGSGRGDD
jgi:hypothetical protein